MIWNYLLLVAGFVLLSFGADWLVAGSCAVAKKLKVSDMVVGLTVVAFGTSAPELVVNIIAGFEGNSEIALTNILGSNAINVAVILGLTGLLCPVVCDKSIRVFEMPLSMLSGVVVFLLCLVSLGEPEGFRGLSRWEGIVMLLLFAVFMVKLVKDATKGVEECPEDIQVSMGWLKAVFLVLVGLGSLIFGGEMIVRCATKIAQSWGVSDAVIGVTVVALGTSLPELATSVVAALHQKADLAIGNIIGSNIFNVYFVLALSSVIHPLAAYDTIFMDCAIAFVPSALLFAYVFGKKHRLNRWGGLSLLLVYAAYLVWLLRSL